MGRTRGVARQERLRGAVGPLGVPERADVIDVEAPVERTCRVGVRLDEGVDPEEELLAGARLRARGRDHDESPRRQVRQENRVLRRHGVRAVAPRQDRVLAAGVEVRRMEDNVEDATGAPVERRARPGRRDDLAGAHARRSRRTERRQEGPGGHVRGARRGRGRRAVLAAEARQDGSERERRDAHGRSPRVRHRVPSSRRGQEHDARYGTQRGPVPGARPPGFSADRVEIVSMLTIWLRRAGRGRDARGQPGADPIRYIACRTWAPRATSSS